MLACNTVAMLTQSRYGLYASATPLCVGQIAAIAQTIVNKIIIMSNSAKKLLRKPNCSGVKAKFAAKFIQNGNPTFQLSLPVTTWLKTKMLTAKIITYSTLHTWPNTVSTGAQEGFFSVLYQLFIQ